MHQILRCNCCLLNPFFTEAEVSQARPIAFVDGFDGGDVPRNCEHFVKAGHPYPTQCFDRVNCIVAKFDFLEFGQLSRGQFSDDVRMVVGL